MGSTQFPARDRLMASFLNWREAFLANRVGTFIRKRFEYFLAPVFLLLVYVIWLLIIQYADMASYILPTPTAVWRKFLRVWQDGTLLKHTSFTMFESFIGFSLAFAFASVTGYILAKSPFLEKLASPYLVAAQTVPLIAIAPLLVIWLGFGMASKAFISLVIVFFPMLVNTIVGIRLVDEDQRELMRSYSASRWHIFSKLELPSALPVLLGGLKIGISMAITGALVGEYVGSNSGLGFMILHAKQRFDTAQVFVSIFVLVIINVSLYGAVSGLEGILLSGRRREDSL